MKWSILLSFVIFFSNSFTQIKENVQWLGKSNRILNPGAEANDNAIPLYWKTDFPNNGETNWVSPYGVTSHEWNSGSKPLGLPSNAGMNYFRLTVNNHEGIRKVNLYQDVFLTDLKLPSVKDSVIAVFSCQVASNSYLAENCSFAKIRLYYSDEKENIVDSLSFHRVPAQFKDVDADSPESIERGFSVMHEFQTLKDTRILHSEAMKVRVELYCEFPCYVKSEDDQGPEIYANTFFFDNITLGFFKKK
jgi:hypothetical protein